MEVEWVLQCVSKDKFSFTNFIIIFANDVLGYTSYNGGHIPRHARIYRDFKKEYEKLQEERVKAFKEYHNDTVNKKFDDPKITVGIKDNEFDKFLELAEKY